ncbi:MAG: hypothetical protein K5776_10045 [Lachnospiraceae bacterium]|nr:hypothetical protein [Lachnospiraceae bacterium]
MKNRIMIPAIIIAPLILLIFSGCRTEVIDINKQLGSSASENIEGIPVEYNENYVEVAYDPAKSPEAKQKAEEEAREKEEEALRAEKEKEELRETLTEETSEEDLEDEEEEETEEDAEDGEEDEETDEEDNASVIPEEFDPEFYAQTYPDVVAIYGNSPEALYKHYREYGKAEGRSCNAEEYALLNETADL